MAHKVGIPQCCLSFEALNQSLINLNIKLFLKWCQLSIHCSMGWMPLEMGRSNPSQSPKVFSVLTDAVQYIYIQQCSSNKRYNVCYCCCVTVRGLWIAQAVLVALGFGCPGCLGFSMVAPGYGRVALVAWGCGRLACDTEHQAAQARGTSKDGPCV